MELLNLIKLLKMNYQLQQHIFLKSVRSIIQLNSLMNIILLKSAIVVERLLFRLKDKLKF